MSIVGCCFAAFSFLRIQMMYVANSLQPFTLHRHTFSSADEHLRDIVLRGSVPARQSAFRELSDL